METIIFIFVLLFLTLCELIQQGLYLIHRLQQLGYNNLKFIKWLEGNHYRNILLWNIFELLFPLLIIYILFCSISEIPVYKYMTGSIMLIVFAWKFIHPFLAGWIGPKAKVKIPLKFTPRIIRLIISMVIIVIMTLVLVAYFTIFPIDTFSISIWRFFQFNTFLLLISIIAPIIVLSSNIVNMPIEKSIHFWFFQKAKKKVLKSNLVNIGITGSFGKTSVKYFLATILQQKYKTLFTPSSFNTPMGISKVINQNNLNNFEVFVVEMGADKKGDIDILCKLVKPDYSIVTAIDNQHLETFLTLDNIIKTKLSLFSNTDKKGFGIYNYDNAILKENIKKEKFDIKLFSYSIYEDNANVVDIYAKNIIHSREGLEFSACFKNGESIKIRAQLLGRHNVSNLLACILFSKKYGLSTTEIVAGIRNIKPVEHRLQMIHSPGGVLVLDDAFNANLNGAIEACRVLKEINGNKKIIVTPGLIGLGEKEDEYNNILGTHIATNTDIAILVGVERTSKIYAGIMESNFNKDNLYLVNSLSEAQGILKKILKAGDVVLFENDLPDVLSD